MTIKILTFIIVFSISFVGNTQEIKRDVDNKGINTGNHTRIFKSKINGKEYKLYINLPYNYESNIDLVYPVLYVLDGQWDFASIVSTQKYLYKDKLIPELITVGISYAGENPNYSSLRTNDLTPTVISERKNSGNSESFSNVLRSEIITLIEKQYRVSRENRTLAGFSFGGLFTHFMLFNHTDLFHNYIICNPSYWYDNELSFIMEEAYYKNNKTLKTNVFLVSGSLDDTIRHNKMARQIESRNYAGLNFKMSTVEGFGHNSSKSEGYARGILHSHKIKTLQLPENDLLEYIGEYEFTPGQSISIILHEDHLAILEFNGFVNIPLYFITKDQFSLQGTYRTLKFNKNDTGDVISLSTKYNKAPVTLKKVK